MGRIKKLSDQSATNFCNDSYDMNFNHKRASDDLKVLDSILGKHFTRLFIKKSHIPNKSRKYVNVKVTPHECGWLWRCFFNFLMPYQLRNGFDKTRRIPLHGYIYSMTLMLIISIIIIFFKIPEIAYMIKMIIWSALIIATCWPYLNALLYLNINKAYYKVLEGVYGKK